MHLNKNYVLMSVILSPRAALREQGLRCGNRGCAAGTGAALREQGLRCGNRDCAAGTGVVLREQGHD